VSSSVHKTGLAALICLASAVTAGAQTDASHDLPTGDVWIAPSDPAPFANSAADNSASTRLRLPTGDVWLAPDAQNRVAESSAPPRPAAVEPAPIKAGGTK